MMSCLLVIGGSGYVGQLILPFLVKEFSVTVFDLKTPPQGPWKYIYGNVQDQKALRRASNGMDVLLYMAMGSFNSTHHVISSYDVNVKGLHLALEAAKQAGIKRVVYTSTVSVYDGYAVNTYDGYGDLSAGATGNEQVPPLAKTVYALTKQMGEQVCQFFHDRHRLPVLVLRLFVPVSDEERRRKPFEGLVDCRTEASDLARAVISALKSTHSEFEIIHITGDQTGRAYRNEKAKEILGWEPQAEAIECESILENRARIQVNPESLLRARFPERYEQLFRAALLKGDPAIKAWDYYCAHHSSLEIKKDFENEPYLLLPLLYRNLEDHGQSDKLPAKYAGVYRYTWTRNQNLFRDAAQTIQLFLNAGIETMILRGTALSITHYRDYGARPIQEIDITVKTEKLINAFHLLEKNGWTFRATSSQSREFVNAAGNKLCMHWFAGTEAWKRAIPIVIQGVSARALDSTDCLDLMCGIYKWDVLWVPDMFTLINDPSHAIDWECLIKNKKNEFQLLALQTALHYLSVILKANVPEHILDDLMHRRINRNTYFAFIGYVCPAKVYANNPFGRLRELWFYFWRSFPSKNLLLSLIEFQLYLRYRWNSKRWWKFPFAAFSRFIVRL